MGGQGWFYFHVDERNASLRKTTWQAPRLVHPISISWSVQIMRSLVLPSRHLGHWLAVRKQANNVDDECTTAFILFFRSVTKSLTEKQKQKNHNIAFVEALGRFVGVVKSTPVNRPGYTRTLAHQHGNAITAHDTRQERQGSGHRNERLTHSDWPRRPRYPDTRMGRSRNSRESHRRRCAVGFSVVSYPDARWATLRYVALRMTLE